MAKTGYTTYWVPEAGADLEALTAQHQRVFPRNELAIIDGMVKVAVLDGASPPTGASATMPAQIADRSYDRSSNTLISADGRD